MYKNAPQLSTFQKGKIILDIIEGLNGLPNKNKMYIQAYEDDVMLQKIASRTGLSIDSYGREAGVVDIGEFIQITYDWREDKLMQQINKEKRSNPGRHFNLPTFDVDEKLKKAAERFEEGNIPSTGPCDTLIGEIFRAIQRIQYRAFNDGDYCWEIGSPSFISYIFLMSQLDILNYSSGAYNEDTGDYGFKFTDEFLKENSWDGKISTTIEFPLAEDADFIKYQLMDLLNNGKIEDSKNEFDSRDYTRLSRGRY